MSYQSNLSKLGSVLTLAGLWATSFSLLLSNVQAQAQTVESPNSQNSLSNSSSSQTQSCNLNQFKAEYFEIKTKNVINSDWQTNNLFNNPVLTRCEDKIDYDWGRNQKVDEKLPLDYYGARWSGDFLFEGGEYEFSVLGDDDLRLFLDGKEVVKATWQNRQDWQKVKLNLNGQHNIKVEYKEGAKDAYAKVKWERLGQKEGQESAGAGDYCRYKWCPMPIPEVRIDPRLSEQLQNVADEEIVSFTVLFKEQADLSEAYKITDKAQQGKFIQEKLLAVANSSQSNLKNQAQEWQKSDTNLVSHSYYLVNAMGLKTTAAKARLYVNQILAQHPEVRYIEKSGDVKSFAYEYGTDRMEADLVHASGNTGQNVTVGIIDSGVRSTHQDLRGNYRGNITGSGDYNWYDAMGNSSVPTDCQNHGTHVAGTIAGTALTESPNPNGTAPGVNWIASNSICSGDFLSVLNSMQFMFAPIPVGGDLNTQGDPSRRPDIVNNSWGVTGGGNTILYGMVSNWRAANIMPVFSAGNSGPGVATLGSPGDFDISFTVGATDENNLIANFSSRGNSELFPAAVKPNVSAPGVNVLSTWGSENDDSYGAMSGTSMAAPHLSGCAALAKSANPSWSVAQIEDKLMATSLDLGVPGADMEYGYGLVNCQAAATPVLLSPVPQNSLGDFVWRDENNNGLQDQGELGIAGVGVSLLEPTTGAVLATTTTNLNGYYQFVNLVPGNSYELSFSVPAGRAVVTPDVNANGNDYQDSDLLVINTNGRANSTNPFVYTPETAYFFDAGLGQSPQISGFFFRDNNASHRGLSATSPFGSDTPLSGPDYVVRLWEYDPATGQRTDTGQTRVLGSSMVYDGVPGYAFEGLDEAKQYVLQTNPSVNGMILSDKDVLIEDEWTFENNADYYDSDFNLDGFTDPIVPTRRSVNDLEPIIGQKANGVGAGFIPPTGSVGDYVFNDLNQNGLQDPTDTPRAGIRVSLLNPDGSLVTSGGVNFTNPVTTGADGRYLFNNIYPGKRYSLLFNGLNANEDFTTLDANGQIGIDGPLDSDASSRSAGAAFGRTAEFVLRPNEPNLNADAGILRAMSGGVISGGAIAWGSSALGVAEPSSVPEAISTLIGYNNLRQIASGGVSGLALTTDDRVLSWNDPSSCSSTTPGRIDFITKTPQELVIPGGVRQVALSGTNKYLLLNDGRVLASGISVGTGSNTAECQTGDSQGLVELPINNIKEMSPRGNTFLTNDNRVLAVAYETNSFIEKFGPNENVIAIGDNSAIKSDGTLWIWGPNHTGQFGNGTNGQNYQETPVQAIFPAGVQITAVAHSGNHVLALDSTGRVWAWGENYHGQLGNGRNAANYGSEFYSAFESTPALVQGLDNVKAIAASGASSDQTPYWSWGYSVALKNDATVWTWGSDNTNGSPTLGNGGENLDSPLPVRAANFRLVQQISAGGGLVLAITQEGL